MEIIKNLEEYISTVSFIEHMISDETVRGYARDKPRNSNGRITVDLTKPHILEDIDFFREKALFFQNSWLPQPENSYLPEMDLKLAIMKIGIHYFLFEQLFLHHYFSHLHSQQGTIHNHLFPEQRRQKQWTCHQAPRLVIQASTLSG